jgi:putative intracellular protease/amidase
MKIAYVLYPDFTALDLVGPYEVISRWPEAEVHFVARSLDPRPMRPGTDGHSDRHSRDVS